MDAQSQVEFIEKTLTSQLPDGRGSIAWWAIDELCDRGILTSMANIHYSLKRNLSDKRAEQELRFCEARIRVVNRDPDRAKALGSVLTTDTNPDDERLVRWAIEQLAAMHSPAADAELKRFSADLGEEGSLLHQRWSHFKREVDSLVKPTK